MHYVCVCVCVRVCVCVCVYYILERKTVTQFTILLFLPGESHGQWAWQAAVHGVAESDTTEVIQHTHKQLIGDYTYHCKRRQLTQLWVMIYNISFIFLEYILDS